ncbi:hypothetical protein EW145_g5318 [Phellinidium pouzarii]|uniref:ubiquitinyl hydrolase 1 n=1 Tax=Phellinidium pouzarii TaxID=167371 RepID=A0A4S4L564_9AGAM|nr:hypothetical protein EW145_g5318 [Phellinidium pouzarii]
MSSAPEPPPKDVLPETTTLAESSIPTIVEPIASGTSAEASDMSSLSPFELQQLTQNVLDETASSRPLITESIPLAALREEYENGSGSFVQQIDYLRSLALAFAWIERMVISPRNQTVEVAKALSVLDSALLILKAAGFQELAFEDFYDVITSLIRHIIVPEPDGETLTPHILLEAFQDLECAFRISRNRKAGLTGIDMTVSNCIVVLLRLLTSAAIRTDPEAYAPFLFHPESGDEIVPQEFCEHYVEACDHVQITALTKLLKLNVEVAYLDGHSDDGSVSFVEFQNVPLDDNENPAMCSLYYPLSHLKIQPQPQIGSACLTFIHYVHALIEASYLSTTTRGCDIISKAPDVIVVRDDYDEVCPLLSVCTAQCTRNSLLAEPPSSPESSVPALRDTYARANLDRRGPWTLVHTQRRPRRAHLGTHAFVFSASPVLLLSFLHSYSICLFHATEFDAGAWTGTFTEYVSPSSPLFVDISLNPN